MSNEQPASPPRCMQCNKPLTFATWFTEECSKALFHAGHDPSIPGVLLPLSLESEAKDERL